VTVRWRYYGSDGAARGESDAFDDRSKAEAWLSEEWATLADDGVVDVALMVGGEEVYRMPLKG
jgi:hypothetical protein